MRNVAALVLALALLALPAAASPMELSSPGDLLDEVVEWILGLIDPVRGVSRDTEDAFGSSILPRGAEADAPAGLGDGDPPMDEFGPGILPNG